MSHFEWNMMSKNIYKLMTHVTSIQLLTLWIEEKSNILNSAEYFTTITDENVIRQTDCK